MENKKDIGKAISDKLNSLDKTPRDQVWSGISYELQKKKKRRAGFFFFWGKITGIVLIAALTAFYIYERNSGENFFSPGNSKDGVIINSVNGETITVTPNTNKNDGILKGDVTAADDKNAANGNNDISNKNNTDWEKATKNENSITTKNNARGKNGYEKEDAVTNRNGAAKSATKSKFNSVSSKSATAKTNSLSKAKAKKSGKSWAKKTKSKSKKDSKKTDTADIAAKLDTTDKTIENKTIQTDLSSLQGMNQIDKTAEIKAKKKDSLIAKKTKDKEININMYPKDSVKTDSAKTYKKFYVDAFVSPTLYGYMSSGSVLDKSLDSLPKKSEIRFSYGFGLTYDLTERTSIRIGYRKISISYVTQNAYFTGFPPNIPNYSGIDYNPEVSNQSIFDSAEFPLNGAAIMDITQKISYTEIPLEIKYNFLLKKLGLKSVFGFSYLLLDENKISVRTWNGYSQEIGKTKNLSSTSVSVNLGLEVDYPIFKNTKVFVEPMFNYQIKAFSDGNYKPYIFGIHTGIRYSFNN